MSEPRLRRIQVDHRLPRCLRGMDAIEDQRPLRMLAHLVQRLTCAVGDAAVEHRRVVLARAARYQRILKACIIPANTHIIASVRNQAAHAVNLQENWWFRFSVLPYWAPWWNKCSKALVWSTMTKFAPGSSSFSNFTRRSRSALWVEVSYASVLLLLQAL